MDQLEHNLGQQSKYAYNSICNAGPGLLHSKKHMRPHLTERSNPGSSRR